MIQDLDHQVNKEPYSHHLLYIDRFAKDNEVVYSAHK